MENRKSGQMKTIIALFVLILISIFIAGAVTTSYGAFVIRFNDSLNITFGVEGTSQEPVSQEVVITNYSEIGNLVKVYNEDNLDFDRKYRLEYLNYRNNFSDLHFKKIVDKEEVILTIGAKQDSLRGFNISNKNFAFELIACNSYERYCIFRINGVPSKRLFSFSEFENAKKHAFDLDNEFMMKVNSIEFDFCGNKRFCNLAYEAYDVVNISIERKE